MRSCPTATDGGTTPITSSLEIERKYDVDEALVVPDLAQLPGVGSVTAERVHALKATYYRLEAEMMLAEAVNGERPQ